MTAPDLLDIVTLPVLEAAPRLLGCSVRTEVGGEPAEVMLTEVEAYVGASDPASHAFRGETDRNRSMFGPPGTLYVYRSYGIHWCMNVVVEPAGVPHAVLLRGGVPVVGRDVMAQRRGRTDHLTDGPGKLCQALGVDGSFDGTSVFDGPVRLLPGEPVEGDILATPRIGISKAVEEPWRFVYRRRSERGRAPLRD